MPRNPVGWFEIYVSDMTRAKKFYESVFQKKLENLETPVSGIEMWKFPSEMNAPGASGALVKMEACTPRGNGTLVYFSCADCAVEAERASTAGGKIFKPKFSIGQYGFIALVYDTEENLIGLHSLE